MRTRTATLDQARLLRILTAMMLALAAMSLSGCNTTAGIGKDIESAGGALEDAAEDAE